MSKHNKIIIGFISLFLLAIGLYFYSHYDPWTDTKDIGFQGQARRNPFLALQRFSEKQGYKTFSSYSYQKARLDKSDLIIAPLAALPHSESEISDLDSWVYNGGCLIYGVKGDINPDFLPPPSLKELLGIDTISANVEESYHTDKVSYYEDDFKIDMTAEHEIQVLDKTQVMVVSSENEEQVLAYNIEYGDGEIIYLANLDILSNERITEKQHIDFFYAMTNPELFKSTSDLSLLVIYGKTFPSFWQWFYKNGKVAILLLGLYLIFFIWKSLGRFGPKIEIENLQVRSLKAHIRSCGLFLWREGQGDYLILRQRQKIHKLMSRTHFNWHKLDTNEQCEAIAKHTKLQSIIVSEAMNESSIHRDNFLPISQTLQKIRAEI